MSEGRLRPSLASLLLLCLLAAGAVLRLQGLDWDKGQHLHPDERFLTMVAVDVRAPASVVEYFDTARSPLNPANAGHGFFVYGTFPLFFVKALGSVIGWTGYDRIHLAGRIASALFDLATVFLTFRLGLLLAGTGAGLGAAALMAFSTTSIQGAHFFTVDSFATCFTAASLLALARIALGGGWTSHLFFGIAFGLTLACRANLLLLGLLYPLVLGWLWSSGRAGAGGLLRSGVLAVLATVAVFRVFQPYAFAGPGFFTGAFAPAFLRSLREVGAYTSGTVDFPPAVQWIGRLPVVFPARNLLLWGLGPAWGVAALIAVPWGLMRRPPGVDGARIAATRFVLLWAALLFTFHSPQFTATVRYFLPLLPALAVAVAVWLTGVTGHRRLALATFGTVVVLTALWALAFTSIYRRPHTRVAASEWIYDHLPSGSTIATEHWDDGLPLGVGSRSAATYTRHELRLYDDEDEQKRRHLIDTLDASDAIVISSSRLYASIPRTPWRYPLGRRYYELLFGEALGFRLEQVFTSYPALAGLEIRDDDAEEAFTVYDHPKVLVFRKTAEFDRERVATLLGAVSLSNVVRVPPREASALYRRSRPAEIALASEQARRVTTGSDSMSSLGAVARWIVVFELMALACFALLSGLVPHARDHGFGLAKLLAWLGPGTAVWLLASTGLAANSAGTARWAAALLILAGLGAAWRRREALALLWRRSGRTIVAIETVFLGTFVLFLAVRALSPAIFWGEKPMDFAILNACLRAVSLPPADPWFAGATLNYFYFGHAVIAVFANITGVPAAFAFNLALATLAALLATMAGIAVYQVSGTIRAGVTAVLLTVVIGNLAGLRNLATGTPGHIGFDYFWATSRVVPNTINEFPFWNLVFGDLHAHVMAMPLQGGLLYLGALWTTAPADPSRMSRALLAALSAWLLGAVAVTSSWSAPTTAALQCAFVLTPWVQEPRNLRRLATALATVAGIVAGAVVMFWPFWSEYTPPPRNWGLVVSEAATLGEIATVFGVLVPLSCPALAIGVVAWVRSGGRRPAVIALLIAGAGTAGALRSPACGFFVAWTCLGLITWLTAPQPPVRAGALLAAAAGALGIVTETVFLWDRMNTVFKYYLEMWLLLAAAGAVLVWQAWPRGSRIARRAYAGLGAAVLAAGLFTSVTGLAGFLREPRATSRVPTLDGMAYLEADGGTELQAYRWLNREMAGIPVLLEAQGPSYQAYSRVSMNTGLPTVLGWDYHLFQQGRSREQLDARTADVRDIYETTDLARAERLLRQYHVDLVYVGPLERKTYRSAGLAKFARSSVLQPLFRNHDVTIYGTPGRSLSVKTWLEDVPPTALAVPLQVPLREPRGIASAPDGTLVVADFGNRRVQRIGADLRPLATFGRAGSAPGEFRDPCGIAVDRNGNIFVADTWNHRIQTFTPDGEPRGEWHASLYGPRGIAVTGEGTAYVTDTGHHRVVRFSPTGAAHDFVPPGQLDNPVGIALAPDGNIVVADTGHRRIVVFDADGTFVRAWPIDGWDAGQRLEPYLAIGSDGVVWVTDPTGGRVLLFDGTGRALGQAAPTPGVEFPLGITVLGEDSAVVTDGVTGRTVRIQRPPGVDRPVVGKSPSAGTRRLQMPTRKSPAR